MVSPPNYNDPNALFIYDFVEDTNNPQRITDLSAAANHGSMGISGSYLPAWINGGGISFTVYPQIATVPNTPAQAMRTQYICCKVTPNNTVQPINNDWSLGHDGRLILAEDVNVGSETWSSMEKFRGYCILVITYGAGGGKIYIGQPGGGVREVRAYVAQSTSRTPQLSNGIYSFGYWSPFQYLGEYHYAMGYSVVHDLPTISKNVAWIYKVVSARGKTVANTQPLNKPVVLITGDSITAGIGSANNGPTYAYGSYGSKAMAQFGDDAYFVILGFSGVATSYIYPKIQAWVQSLKAVCPGQTCYVVNATGANDIGLPALSGLNSNQMIADSTTLVTNARAGGANKVILMTIAGLDFTILHPGEQAARTTIIESCNSRLLSLEPVQDGTADTTGTALGPPYDGSNATLTPDGVHPSSAGTDLLYPPVVSALEAAGLSL
jgi:lysophospholipase L1-like esterase